MDRIAHPLKVCLAKEFGHRWGRDSSRFLYEHRMSAFLVATGVMVIMFTAMVQIHGFSAYWAVGVILRSGINTFGRIRRPLMATLLAQVLLMPM